MHYTLLTPDDQLRILRERIFELEADHCRTTLLLAEVEHTEPDRARKHRATLAEIERRIMRHIGEPDEDTDSGSKEPKTGEPDSTDRHERGTDGVSEPDEAKIAQPREMLSPAGSEGLAASNGAAGSLEE